MYKKLFLPIVCWVLLGILCAGCLTEEKSISSNSDDDALPTIGLLIYQRNDVFISLVTEAIQTNLTGKARIVLLYADADQLIQNEQIEHLLEQKVDALLINLVDPQRASEALNMVHKAGIPAVFFNREPDLDVIKRYSRACFVGTEASEAGIMQGDIIEQLWKKNPQYDRNKDGVFQYIMLQGNSDSAEAILRTQNSVRQAEAKGVPMRQLGETYVCNWDRMQGKQAMTLAMDSFGDRIELVVSNNDSMALGALDVLNERGFNTGDPQKFIPVIGVDAIGEACEAIRQGRMNATVMQDSKGMGKVVTQLVLNVLNHKDFLTDTQCKWDASGVAIRIPYQPFLP